MFLKALTRGVLATAVLIQFIPYGHNHTNPPVTGEPAWSSPETRELFHRACFDCHSNTTVWPWYSHVAPVSWLVQNDVEGGRHHLNFTEWDHPQGHAEHVAEEVRQGDMPPWYYLALHSHAKFTEDEKQAVMDAAAKILGPQTEH
jgi:hypothetical protein